MVVSCVGGLVGGRQYSHPLVLIDSMAQGSLDYKCHPVGRNDLFRVARVFIHSIFDSMRSNVAALIVLCWLLPVLAMADTSVASDQVDGQTPGHLRVLVLYSNQRTLPANLDVQKGLWSSLEAEISSRQIELFEEYLEIHRLPGDDEEATMAAYLQKRYQKVNPDLIVSAGPQAFAFSGKWLSKAFPQTAQVFVVVREDELKASPLIRPNAGILNAVAARPLLEMVAHLLPDTREIVLVGGNATFDRELLREVRKQIEDTSRWKVTEISGSTPQAIAQELSQLKAGTVVLFTTYFRDAAGTIYIPKKVLEKISQESAVPVFALYDTMLGTGVTGIGASPFIDQGRDLAKMLKRIAAGESPDQIGVVQAPAPRFLFDARAMRRYGMDPNRVPPGVEVFFEKPSLIESHPVAFVVGVVTILIQSFLIIVLLVTRHRKKQAEKQALEMGRYFSTVFRENPNPMAVIRVADRVFEDINPAWEALCGIRREEVIGRNPLEVGVLLAENDGELYEDFLNVNKSLSGYERQLRTGSGEIRNVALYTNAIEINGEQLHIITAVDTSDRIEAERLRNNLARDNRVAQLGQISAWIAHEINQPLGSILNNAEAALMHLDTAKEQSDELREILQDIKAEDRRASRVVQHIRTMMGNHSATKELVSLSEIFEEVCRMASPEAGRRGVELRTPATGVPTGFVLGERVLLVQVLLNLIFNAMDAVAGVPLSRRVITLGCELSADGSRADLTVCDQGPGIVPREADLIFEFFYSTKEGGMGLGLAISKFIIEDHRGELTVENNDGEGACFHVQLPLQRNSA
jgi:PAS domain S-box-containing protein